MEQLKYLVYLNTKSGKFFRSAGFIKSGIDELIKMPNVTPITITTSKKVATSITHNCNVNLTENGLTVLY